LSALWTYSPSRTTNSQSISPLPSHKKQNSLDKYVCSANILKVNRFSTLFVAVDLYPDAIIKRFVDNQTFLQYPEIKLDYTLSLDTDWQKHSQSIFEGSPEAADFKEVHCMRSQVVVNNAVESLLLSLPTDQLAVLVGELVTDANFSTSQGLLVFIQLFVHITIY